VKEYDASAIIEIKNEITGEMNAIRPQEGCGEGRDIEYVHGGTRRRCFATRQGGADAWSISLIESIFLSLAPQ
jgi:hypothetical protein